MNVKLRPFARCWCKKANILPNTVQSDVFVFENYANCKVAVQISKLADLNP